MSVYIPCSECEFGTEDLDDMADHVALVHKYSPEEAIKFAALWQEDALEEKDAQDAYDTEYYKRHGVDPDKVDRDPSE